MHRFVIGSIVCAHVSNSAKQRMKTVSFNPILGKPLVDEGGQESTSVCVQAAAKHSKGNKNGPALPVFNADASKVTIKGMGIKKAFVGKQNSFSVNASEAGAFY